MQLETPHCPPIIPNFRWRSNCHKHALSVQLAQTRLSFDIWLMLSRGTAAGHRKQRTGKMVAVRVVSDSSACCACISPFRVSLSFGWPKTLWPHQMQIKLLFIHQESFERVKMENQVTAPVSLPASSVCICWKFLLTLELWCVSSVNKNVTQWKFQKVSEDFAKPSQFCKFANSLRGNLIMTKCPNTHNSHFIFQKSFSSSELYCNLCQRSRLLPRQPQSCHHGSCNCGEETRRARVDRCCWGLQDDFRSLNPALVVVTHVAQR